VGGGRENAVGRRGRVRGCRGGRLALAVALAGSLGATLAVVPASVAGATTVTVTNCNNAGPGSLRQVVASAAAGDTITFDLSPACSTISDPTGTILILTDMTITGPGPAALAVSGTGTNGVFQVASGVTASLSGLTIEDAMADDGGAIDNDGDLTLADSTLSDDSAVGTASANGNGGAVWNGAGTLTMTDDTVSGGSANGNGGAIFNDGGTVTLTDSTVTGYSGANGGGIDNASGSLTLTGSTVSDNTAAAADGADGGGIDNNGTLTLTSSTVSDNTVSPTSGDLSEGGGVWNGHGDTTTVTDSTVSGNTAGGSAADDETSEGGGLANDDGTVSVTDSTLADDSALSSTSGGQSLGGAIFSAGNYGGGTVTVTASTVSTNTATGRIDFGGGIYSADNGTSGDTVTLENTTVADNTISGQGYGVGVYNGGHSTLNVANSTVVDNVGTPSDPESGDGIYGGGGGTGSTTLEATIVADNGSSGDCYGEITDDGYNVDDDGSCGLSLPSISDYATLSRTLGPLADNGGPTQTIALLPASPAIDYVPAADCPPTDQRGVARTAPCDIGAYDTDGLVAQVITFTSTAPTGATVGGPSYPVTATGGASGNPVTFIIDSLAASVCTIAGAVVSFTGAGTCTIDANQDGNAEYQTASQVQQSFAVTSPGPRPTIARFTPAKGKVGRKITVTGTNLAGATLVSLDGTAVTPLTDKATKITFKVPVGATTGTISVTTAGGTVTSTTSLTVK
jgi:hypothetical protein